MDWIFTQRGAIRVEVGLTGIDAAKGVRSTTLSSPTAAADTQFGALVARNLVAINHSHHFNFRLDLDVDGPKNSFMLGRLKTMELNHNPRNSVWVVDEQRISREQDAQLDENHSVWRVINPSKRNANGYNTGYVVESHANAEPLLKKADYRRARFIGHNLWVTVHDPDERYAAGDTPNESPGEPGLPQYIADNQSLVDADLVLWLTVGFHHVPVSEDFPVLSRETLAFEIRPAHFFDRNPALDLRRAPFEAL
jgi:primary-amine oxidase